MKKDFLKFFLLAIFASLPFTIEKNVGGMWVTSSDLLIVCSFLLGAVKIVREKSFERMRFPVFLLISTFLLICGLSAIGAVNRFFAVKELAKYLLFFGFFYLLINEISDKGMVRLIPYIVFISSVITSAWFLHDSLTQNFSYFYSKIWERPPFSTVHFNLLASYIAIALPFGFYVVFNSQRTYVKIIALGGLVVDLCGLVFCYSRLNWLIAALITLIIFIWKFRLKGLLLGALFLVVPAMVLAKYCPDYGLSERFLSAFRTDDYSLKERERFAAAALRLGKRYPVLGVGIGNYRVASIEYFGEDVNEMAHNIYLQLWSESGFLAMSLFIMILLKYLIDVRKIALLPDTHALAPIMKYSLLSFAAMVLSNQFGDPFVRVLREQFALLLAFPYIIEKIITENSRDSG